MTTICGAGDSGSGQAQNCVRVKQFNVTPSDNWTTVKILISYLPRIFNQTVFEIYNLQM
jgi:hypothetical protein